MKIFEVVRSDTREVLSVETCRTKIPYGLSLDAFVKFRKATVSFVKSVGLSIHPSVRPPVRVEERINLAPTGRIIMLFDI
jgi:hypothetical protein